MKDFQPHWKSDMRVVGKKVLRNRLAQFLRQQYVVYKTDIFGYLCKYFGNKGSFG